MSGGRNLDLTLVRAFAAVVDGGGVTRAAERLNLTQPTVSLQLKRLEGALGVALFAREGRRLRLTEEGERFESHARELLALNDRTVAAFGGTPLAGEVELGVAQDLAGAQLSGALARFAKTHPGVRLRVRVDRSRTLAESARSGGLDAALVVQSPEEDGDGESLARMNLIWLGGEGEDWAVRDPLPLALFDAPCLFRQAALEALESAGRTWEAAFVSPSLPGVMAAVRAGLGVTVRTPLRQDEVGVTLLDGPDWPELPEVEIAMFIDHRSSSLDPAVTRTLEKVLRAAVHHLEFHEPL